MILTTKTLNLFYHTFEHGTLKTTFFDRLLYVITNVSKIMHAVYKLMSTIPNEQILNFH